VELTGEAYFEITPDKSKPFFVKTAKADVRVLGTGFNVNAYDDEASVKTTLVHGSVQVSSKAGNIIIRPGQQATVADAAKLPGVSSPDMDEVLAWKEGDFVFKNADIRTIMRQLARWYDVEVVYEGTVPNVGLSGTVHRRENATQLLDALALTKQVNFKIEGKKIIVRAGAHE
jgi:ferric-dicitrate binding protein FerR (iron transport regulator)